jgi:hypothetical protein
MGLLSQREIRRGPPDPWEAPGRKPLSNWISLIAGLGLDPAKIAAKEPKALLLATNARDKAKVQLISQRMFKRSVD